MSDLFSGIVTFSGLSNERELAKQIPEAFHKHNNPWADYASKLFFNGGNTQNWKWKSTDPAVRKQQKACLHAVLSGWDLRHEDKEGLVGWMLSEMLTEIPR